MYSAGRHWAVAGASTSMALEKLVEARQLWGFPFDGQGRAEVLEAENQNKDTTLSFLLVDMLSLMNCSSEKLLSFYRCSSIHTVHP